MKNEPVAPAQPLEPTFDRTPQPFGSGPPDPLVCDASARSLRQRTVNFAAKRMVDMLYVSGLDRETADRHFRWRPAAAPGDLASRPAADDAAPLIAAHRAGDVTVETDDADRRVKVVWNDPGFGEPVRGAAIGRPGYGGILLGEHPAPLFDPQPLARQLPDGERPWPMGAAVETPPPEPSALADALDNFFTNSAGAYGILIATPDRVFCERYSAFGAPARATPSWSMTKAITCTLIGRLIHEGWLASVYIRRRRRCGATRAPSIG